MTLADKHDDKKLRMELVPMTFVVEVAEVMTHGATKYDANNWRKGLPWMRTFGALLRHLSAWSLGETFDRETGFSHLAHACCNLLFLMEWQRTHPELDDRKQI